MNLQTEVWALSRDKL